MEPQRWARIESLYHAALAKAPGERPDYIAAACAAEPDLRREVESLLGFANAELPSPVGRSRLWSPGERLGSYEIVSMLGAGGMGEVYRARDAKLKRDVALKVLPEAFAREPERLARFQREAEVLACLNHPNIAHIYGVEERALVMEFVEGESPKGPIPWEAVRKIAAQLGEALAYAHEKGIVHRDLKPANVKITPDGVVKLLDFGLAAVMLDSPENPETTLTMSPSRPGMAMGTPAYMSPDQVRGQKADKRADIWAFGVVLYELLDGKPPFRGETASDTLAAVLKGEPDLERVPREVRRLLRSCLEKDPKQRLQAIGDWRLPLEDSEILSRTAPPAPVGGAKLAWAAAGLLALVSSFVTATYFGQRAEAPVIRSEISPPPARTFSRFNVPALSPDGRRLVFSAQSADGKDQLWLRSLDTLAAQPLAGTEGGRNPFWSPDSKSIGFFTVGGLKRVEAAGGPVLTLASRVDPQGTGTWNADGVIVFGVSAGGLQKVSATGGDLTTLSRPDRPKENSHRWPWFLPDGKHFLFTAVFASAENRFEIRIGSLDSPETRTLMEADSNAVYSLGHLLFLRGATLMAHPFELRTMKLTGEAVPVADQVRSAPQLAAFSASAKQELVYASDGGVTAAGLELAWFDRGGKRIASLGNPAAISRVFLSPDQKSVTVSLVDPSSHNSDIWIFDVEPGAQGLRTHFSFDPAQELYAVWSPDDKSIVFNSDRRGHLDLYRKPADGSSMEELLYADSLEKYPTGWSQDGKFLLYNVLESPNTTAAGVWVLPDPLGRPGSAKPYRFVGDKQAMFGQFSPDGKWVAYTSTASGNGFQIYATPFPGPGAPRQISTGGGRFPRWRRDGKELFYVAPSGELMAAEVAEKGSALDVGRVTPLFPTSLRLGSGFPYDVSADGRRFLLIVPPEGSDSEPLKLVQNWTALLKK
jgi:serine/threonine protein kinase